MFVNGDGAREDEALAVVVGQRYRSPDAERARSLLLPDRLGTGHGHIDAGSGNPAEFSIEGLRRARRGKQHDRRRLRIGLFAILRERQVVDAAALKIDAAAEPRCLDRDPRRGSNHRFARSRLRLSRGAGFWRSRYFRRCRLGSVRRWRGRLRGSRLPLRWLFELRFLALPLHLRIADEILPANDHEQRQHDGQNGVLVLAHSMLVLTGPLFGIRLALAPAAFGPTRPMWGQCVRCTSSAAAFAGAAFTGGVDAAKRAAKFLHHRVKRHLECGTAPNQYVVVTGGERCRWSEPDEFTQSATHPVALHGVADLFAHGKANPRRASLRPRACLQDKGAGMNSRAGPGSLGNGPKVTPAF